MHVYVYVYVCTCVRVCVCLCVCVYVCVLFVLEIIENEERLSSHLGVAIVVSRNSNISGDTVAVRHRSAHAIVNEPGAIAIDDQIGLACVSNTLSFVCTQQKNAQHISTQAHACTHDTCKKTHKHTSKHI